MITLSLSRCDAFSRSSLHEIWVFSRDRFMCHVVSERQQFVVCFNTNSQHGVGRTNIVIIGYAGNSTRFFNQSQLPLPLVCRTLSCYRVPCLCGVQEAVCRGSGRTIRNQNSCEDVSAFSEPTVDRQCGPVRALRSARATLGLRISASAALSRRAPWL